MSKHTPGPWAVNRYITSGNQSLGFHITGPRDGSVSPVCVGEDTGYGEIDANARLIAAAPDLLVALRSIVEEVDGPGRPFSSDSYLPSHLIQVARATITKAEGGEA